MRESEKLLEVDDSSASLSSGIPNLLFKSKSSPEVRPFDSIPDLGRAMARLPDGQHTGKESVVTSFLRQVFNGDRPCPNEYLKAIVAATRLRVEERSIPTDVDNLVAHIEKGIPALKKRRERRIREKHQSRSIKPFGAAEVRFIVNPPLGVFPIASSGIKRISQLIADSIYADTKSGSPGTTYKICFPVETDAVDQWRLIFDELTGKFNDSGDFEELDAISAADRIQAADSAGRLQIYVVPYFLCLASALIDNPDSRDECAGVTLQVEKGVQTKLNEIRERNIVYWRQMYYDLENGVFGEYRRLEFAKYRNLVTRRPGLPEAART